MRKRLHWLAFVWAVFLCGCGSGTDSTLPPSVAGLFEITAIPTKPVFSRDEPVTVTFSVKNVSGNSVESYERGFLPYGLDVSQNGRQVGPPSQGDGGETADMPRTVTYQSGQAMTYEKSWEQRDVSNTPVGPGIYKLVFWYQPLKINGLSISTDAAKAHMAAAPVTVTIQ